MLVNVVGDEAAVAFVDGKGDVAARCALFGVLVPLACRCTISCVSYPQSMFVGLLLGGERECGRTSVFCLGSKRHRAVP